MNTMHKRIGLNRQDAKVSEEDLPRTHAALTGICRSDGLADTLIREFIRVFGCLPIHVRIADSAASHSSQPVSLVKSAFICVNLRFLSWRPWRFNLIRVHPSPTCS
ncbi:MAG: hypothetical protein ACOYCD_09740 [Kiritimatiellia bacterium]